MKTFSKEPGREPRRRIACPVCDADEFRHLWSSEHYSFARCRGCGLVYQNPQPLQTILVQRYDEEYFAYEKENEEQYYKLMRLGLDDIGFGALASAIPKRKRSIVDVGCATGRLISSLRDSGWRVQGVEICAASAEYGERTYGVPIHIGTLESGGFGTGSFSVGHCSHLIEHLTDPNGFLQEIRRILTADGWLIISTPNIAGFQARVMGEKWRSAIADHIILYSRKTLGRLLKANGFQICRTKTWGGIGAGIAPGWIKKPADFLAKRTGVGDVMIVLARRIP